MTYQEITRILECLRGIWDQHRRRPPASTLEELEAETNLAHLPWRSRITGYGIGQKHVDGKKTNDYALRLYVRRKLATARLDTHERIPKRLHLKRWRTYVPIDVIEQPQPFVGQSAVNASSLVSHFKGDAGIIGLGVRSVNDGRPLLLSCAHVFAPRDVLLPDLADNIIESPPIPNSNSLANRIGVLRSFTKFGKRNTIDAATCEPDPSTTFAVGQIGGRAISGVWDPTAPGTQIVGRKVWRINKNGSQVAGEITAIDEQSVAFNDGFPAVQFVSILRYECPNQGGDSGGAVIDTLSDQIIGLHFAGSALNQSLLCLASLIFPNQQISHR